MLCAPHTHRIPEVPRTRRQSRPRLRLRIICDNYATHNHPKARAWLDRIPRITMHFTPTSCSWLNTVEIFFGITRRAIRCGIAEASLDNQKTAPSPNVSPIGGRRRK
uniref:transposase n=1 Tax=Mycolicibacterium fortuitum TaxID=1766 RepID=UPI00351E5DA8